MTTVEMLEQRVAALERELAEIKSRLPTPKPIPEAGYWGELAEKIPMIREALESHPPPEFFEKLLKDMGLDKVEPIGAEQLQAMLIAEGWDPTDNWATRTLIEMRDEE